MPIMPDRPRRWRSLGASVAVAVTVGVLLGLARYGEPRVAAARTAVASLPVASDTPASQSFWVDIDGLDSVTLTLQSGSVRPRSLRFELRDESTATVLRQATLDATLPADGWQPVTWRFAPLEGFRRRSLAVSVRPDAPLGASLTLLVNPDPASYRLGRFSLGVRPQWGDLVFGTTATGAVPLVGLRAGLDRDWPGWTGRAIAGMVFVVVVLAHAGFLSAALEARA